MQQDDMQRPQRTSILFTHYGDNWLRGSERCLLDLLTHLDKSQFRAILWCNNTRLASAAEQLGIKVYRTDFPLLFGWLRPRYDIAAFIGLVQQARRLIRHYDIALIHANSAAPCQWLNVAARSRRIPVIAHLHCHYQLRDRILLGLYHATLVVGVSQYVINDLLRDLRPVASTKMIANGIDCARLQVQPKRDLLQLAQLNSDDFIIVSVGSLIQRKGMDLLISALPLLLAQGIPARLVIIGSGNEADSLRQQVNQLKLQQQVRFLGEQDNVFGLLHGADLFVSAAREEAFGLVLAEASLAGLAVIAPSVGGVADVVVDGKTGILIPPNSSTALTTAIAGLYRQPHSRQAMAKAGQQHIQTHFDSVDNCHKFQHIYQQQLQESTARPAWYKPWTYIFYAFANACKRLIIRKINHAN